jgi:hypothetical protein
MTDPGPETGDRHPADVVTGMAAFTPDDLDGSAFYADSVGMLGR